VSEHGLTRYAGSVVLVLAVWATASATDGGLFDRVQAGVYADMQHEATLAYDRKDYARAFELNRRAACAGDRTSQAILGRMYLLGQGTARDDVTGYAWIRFAADFGYRDFTSLARKLEAALPPEQRAQGNALADTLRVRYGPAVTNMSCHGEARHGVYVIDAVICTPDSDGGQVLLRRCVDEAPK
jgi:TPR repeat protein